MTLGGYAADSLPFLAAWLFFAWRTRRFVPTWLIGVTLGVIIRMAILGHYRWNELAFWLVSLVFIGGVAFGVWITASWVSTSSTRRGS